MTTNHSPHPDDLITRVVESFDRIRVPHAPSLRETLDLVERAESQRQQETAVASGPPTFAAAGGRQISPAGWKRIVNQGKEIMRRPLPRFLVAAACMAIVAIWLLVPGQQTAAQAFNEFAKALVDAKSATFQLEVTVAGYGPQKLQSYYLAPGKMRSEMTLAPGEMRSEMTRFVTIADMKTGETVNLLPEQKTALIMNIKNVPHEPGKPQFNDFFEQLRELLSKSRSAQEDGVKQLGEKEIDGRRVIGFRCDSALESMTLWGDPATGLPVLVESTLSGLPRIEYTMSRFFFNGNLDPALFDLVPPADYKIQIFDIDASKPTVVALIDALRVAADLNDGVFPDDLNAVLAAAGDNAPVDQQPKPAIGDPQNGWHDMTPELLTIGRGLTFALELPASAEAHYAGKGVKRGEPNRPIFWYKPEGGTTYRVIYADFSVKDAETAPEVASGPLVASGPSTFQAFNMFAEAILEARTVTYESNVTLDGKPAPERRMQCYYLAPGKFRHELKENGVETVFINDDETGTRVILSPYQKTIRVMQVGARALERRKKDDFFEQMRVLLSNRQDAKGEFTSIGESMIDGIRAAGFRKNSLDGTLTLWGNPATGLPVLIEVEPIRTHAAGGAQRKITLSHFKLNADLKPELFDTTPPEGYTVERVVRDPGPTEEMFIGALDECADRNQGLFPDNLDFDSLLSVQMRARHERRSVDSEGIYPGVVFVQHLPEWADAHYAGSGVQRGEPRPIFWYKAKARGKYRVISADLTVKEIDHPPAIPGAIRWGVPETPDQKAAREAMEKLRPVNAAIGKNGLVQNQFSAAIRGKDGKPLLSWRVALLPWLGEEELYKQFHLDEPWDSEHNLPLVEKMPACFLSEQSDIPKGKTAFLVPVGPETIFSDEKETRSKDISDELGLTISLVEVDAQHAVPWTKPEDLTIDPQHPAAGLHVEHGFYLFGRADVTVGRLPADIDAATLWGFFTRAGGEKTKWPQSGAAIW